MEKKQRVILNLTTDQAKEMQKILSYCIKNRMESGDESFPDAEKLLKRIDRTILKQAFIARCQADGIGKPTKEAMKNFMEGLK